MQKDKENRRESDQCPLGLQCWTHVQKTLFRGLSPSLISFHSLLSLFTILFSSSFFCPGSLIQSLILSCSSLLAWDSLTFTHSLAFVSALTMFKHSLSHSFSLSLSPSVSLHSFPFSHKTPYFSALSVSFSLSFSLTLNHKKKWVSRKSAFRGVLIFCGLFILTLFFSFAFSFSFQALFFCTFHSDSHRFHPFWNTNRNTHSGVSSCCLVEFTQRPCGHFMFFCH